jgi:hypothetical protein
MVCIQSILMQASNVSEVVERLTTHPKIDGSKIPWSNIDIGSLTNGKEIQLVS